jgi:hypothetical protein
LRQRGAAVDLEEQRREDHPVQQQRDERRRAQAGMGAPVRQ